MFLVFMGELNTYEGWSFVASAADELLLLKSILDLVQYFVLSVICTQIWLASLARDFNKL